MGRLVIERYRSWFERLPEIEKDTPYLMKMVAGKEVMLTPRQVLEEMARGTPLGRELQRAEEKLLEEELKWKRETYRRS